ncbi:hypothetical protein FB451DRAFT_1234617 [Mycena latifolia]|nr:hypothetical protein FB451DRAFT_1234617 [Mycena latifolia]
MNTSAFQCPTCGAHSWAQEPHDSNIHVSPAAKTRHHGLLTSNEVPLESDLIPIKTAISKTDARLADLNADISELRDRLKHLEEEHTFLSKYRAQNYAILSPLRRMPPEVLGEIFSWTLPSASEAMAAARLGFDLGSSPWLLTRISSRWRAVSLSHPSLWSLVVIDYSRSSRYPPSLPMLETQIARARNLKIHFYGCEETASSRQLASFQCLVQRSSLWEELSIGLTSDLFPLLPTLRDCVPSLRKLWLQWTDSEHLETVESIDTFRTASSLTDVGICSRFRFIPIPLPVHQLTRYDISAPWEVHDGILKLSPNLVEARVVIAFDEEPWPAHGDIVTLPRLQRLFVSEAGTLNYLRAPVLQEIGVDIDDPDLLLPDLVSFFLRSVPRRVCFRGSPDPDIVGEILHKCSSVTELAIIACNPFARDLDELCETARILISQLTIPDFAESTAVSPRLAAIDFGCEDDIDIDHALYLKMLESRWRAANCALKSATLVTGSYPIPNSVTLDGLHSIRKEGLNLSLLHGREGTETMDGWSFITP